MDQLPPETVGLRLCKVIGDDLILCEPVIFERGINAVDTVLRRARIAGAVGPIGETGDYWAYIPIKENCDCTETIALDRNSWNILKNKWMRCRLERQP